ncbi:MAG: rhodanese-like domain-containing protein [Sulfurovaceae bacterium]|nr:rhodanese-like domain-containing protein [Sulfurovaceae bacterium]
MNIKKRLLILSLFSTMLMAEEITKVKITKDIPYAYTSDSGKKIKIERIQDTDNKLTDDYTKTSRPCPPFCIQPTKIDPEIRNIAELELILFMQNEVKNKTGIIIDARLKRWYEVETIPSAINIPFPVMQNASKAKAQKIFKLLGMTVRADGSWDFSKAKILAVFCNGVWCEQTAHFMKGILKHNYPKDKLSYYRSGFQGWKLLGITTIVHKEIKQ